MQRILKFRVWNKKNKWFFDDNYHFHINGIGRLLFPNGRDEYLECLHPENFIITQFTGLQDKNGKDIYEGDILKLEFGGETWIGEVKWDKYLELKCNDGGWTSISMVHINMCGIVIGNIFETPELLK